MKKRRRIGMVVSVLLIAAILMVILEPWDALGKKDRRLRLDDTERIDRIILSDSNDSTALEKRDNAWFISGSETVNPVTVENLLYAAKKLQIASIQTAGPELKGKMLRSVRYYEGEKLLLQYNVGSLGGRFMIRPEQSEKVFTVSIPGYAGLDLNKVFSSHTNHYREHMLIDMLPSEILHIEVKRRGEEAFRFSMDAKGRITSSLPAKDSILAQRDLDDLSIRLLFSYFTSIRYEARAGESAQLHEARVDRDRWMASLYVESRLGEIHSLEVFSIPGDKTMEPHMFQALVLHNDDPEPLIINYIYLDVLMRGLDSYKAPV